MIINITNRMNNRKNYMDSISEQNNEESQQAEANHIRSNSASSDFSDFDLRPKDIADRQFSPYHKPSHKGQNGKKIAPKNRKGDKINQNAKKTEKTDYQKTVPHQKRVFFGNSTLMEKKTAMVHKPEKKKPKNNLVIEIPQASQKSSRVKAIQIKNNNRSTQQQNAKKSRQNQQNPSEELIVEHDKTQFKKSIRECVEQQPQSRPKRHARSVESQVSQKEDMTGSCIVESKGGICFDMDVKEFASPPSKRGKTSKKRKVRKDSYLRSVNSNADILRRRQMAFNYGQLIRMRTFGYL